MKKENKVILAVAAGAALLFGSLVILNKWQVNISLNGEKEIHLEYGDSYEEPGAEAVFTGSILRLFHKDLEVKTDGQPDTQKLGTYTVTYSAANGRYSAEETRTVIVEDTTPPEITLVSDPDGYTLYGHTYEEEGYSASDSCDGDLTDKVTREEKNGKVIYTVKDASGNSAEKERTIVYDDRTGPEISLAGGDYVTVYTGSSFDEGYSASDDCDGDVTGSVSVSGTVDTNTPGDYVLTYEVSDAHGNVSSMQRTVHVENMPVNVPTIQEGGNVIYLTFDDGPGPYTDALLDILDRYNVKATFFTTSAYPGYAYCMARAAAAGHTVAVHSATHDYGYIYSSTDNYWSDFNTQNAVIAAQTGSYSNLFRFPGGSSNTVSMSYCSGIMTTLAQQAASYGYIYFDWNVSSGDAGATTDTNQVYANVIGGIAANSAYGTPSVVLQHDVKAYSVNAVESIIQWGLQNGYSFQALSAGSYTSHHGINN